MNKSQVALGVQAYCQTFLDPNADRLVRPGTYAVFARRYGRLRFNTSLKMWAEHAKR